jgi:acyl-CoA synthetase (AMP-forming)/AMP-acid ligase II
MSESTLMFELIAHSAQRTPGAPALTAGASTVSYAALQTDVAGFAAGMMALGLERGARVAIYLEKRFEGVVASFGAPAAGGVFVPLNPLLKPEQVGYILRDCNVRVLITSPERLALLVDVLAQCPDLRHLVAGH